VQYDGGPPLPEDDDLDTPFVDDSTPNKELMDDTTISSLDSNNSNSNNNNNNSCNDAEEDEKVEEAPTTRNNPTSDPLCNMKGQAIHPFFLSQGSNTTERPADGRKSTTTHTADGGIEHNSTVMPPAMHPIQTPPTIANPYQNSELTNARDAEGPTVTNGAEGGGSSTTPSIPQANAPPIPLPCSIPKELSEEEIMAEDPLVQQLTAADRKLISLYGDTIHQNDGCHLHGGIDHDISIQHQVWWVQVIATPCSCGTYPMGSLVMTFSTSSTASSKTSLLASIIWRCHSCLLRVYYTSSEV
jgi:hypothetical protein